MLRIAFVDHAFHVKTRSTVFMLEYLQKHGVVDVFNDTSPFDGIEFPIKDVVKKNYDLIVVFQMSTPAVQLSNWNSDRLVFIPMYDGAWDLADHCWIAMRKARILNFCQTLHEKVVTRFGMNSRCVQYFPEAETVLPDYSGLHGFFWHRSSEIGWATIRRLIGETQFECFNLHMARDPGAPEDEMPTIGDVSRHNIHLTKWFSEQSQFQEVLSRSNVFFASRRLEGIGMSFLEAMARGQCVVAPNEPTMSEYIQHGVNGLLYDPFDPRPLDFSNVAKMGQAAQRTVSVGRARWVSDMDTIVEPFLFAAPPQTIGTKVRRAWRGLLASAY